MGRLCRDPEIRRVASGDRDMCIANYTLAVDRRYKKEGEQAADFPRCVVFGKGAEFAEKYLHQGTKICVTGRLQTGSFTGQDGVKHYTTDVIVEDQEFAESKAANDNRSSGGVSQTGGQALGGGPAPAPSAGDTGFLDIPDGIDEEVPFN